MTIEFDFEEFAGSWRAGLNIETIGNLIDLFNAQDGVYKVTYLFFVCPYQSISSFLVAICMTIQKQPVIYFLFV